MTTSSLTLVSHPLCPFVQRAAIALLEKQVSFERVDVDLSAKPDWFLAISPTGKVPLLKVRRSDGEEVILFESMVIAEYLEETQPGAKLHPANALERARHRAWIEFGTTALGDAWGFLNAKDEVTAQEKRAAFRAKLERLDGVLGDGPWFAGDAFSLVDAVFAPIFRYFDILEPAVSSLIFSELSRVQAWRAALSTRPSVVAAVGTDYGDRFREHLRKQQALLAA